MSRPKSLQEGMAGYSLPAKVISKINTRGAVACRAAGREAATMIESNFKNRETENGIRSTIGRDLAEKAVYYLQHREEASRIGGLAREAIASNRGAAARHAEAIAGLLRP